MSVKRTWWMALLAVSLLQPMPSLAAEKQDKRVRQVRIVKAEQLENDPAVRKLHSPYRLAASALYITKQCKEPLALTDDQVAFIAQQFEEASATYIKGLGDAYMARIQAPADDELKKDFVRYLEAQQQPAVDDTAKVITNAGCEHRQIKGIVAYFSKLQQSTPAVPTAVPSAATPNTQTP